jgi:hypothetical protein
MAQKQVEVRDARKVLNATKRALDLQEEAKRAMPRLEEEVEMPRAKATIPKEDVDDRPRVNPVTWALCGNTFFLCRTCRAWLGKGRRSEGKDGAHYFTVRMCNKCLKVNGEVRELYKEYLF